jgi:hypothetical protein
MDIVPQHKTIEVVATGKEDSPFGLLGHPMGKSNVFFGL